MLQYAVRYNVTMLYVIQHNTVAPHLGIKPPALELPNSLHCHFKYIILLTHDKCFLADKLCYINKFSVLTEVTKVFQVPL